MTGGSQRLMSISSGFRSGDLRIAIALQCAAVTAAPLSRLSGSRRLIRPGDDFGASSELSRCREEEDHPDQSGRSHVDQYVRLVAEVARSDDEGSRQVR